MTSFTSILAYIDPGSGSLVLQMVVASVVGAVAFFRHQIARFFGLFKSSKKTPGEPPVDRD